MTKTRSPFLPINTDIDDAVIERIAHAKGVPTLSIQDAPKVQAEQEAPTRAVVVEVQPIAIREGEGAAASVASAHEPQALEPRTAPTPRSRVAYVKAGIPDYAYKELALRQIEDNVTINYLILQGLRAIGISIAEDDMIEDGRRLRGRRAQIHPDSRT